MSSSSDENEDSCGRCHSKLCEAVNKPKKKPTVFEDCHDGSAPSTSSGMSVNRHNSWSKQDNNCSDIRNMTFLKNCYKNVPEPSEQFLSSVNCAVNKLLHEIEENHKLCVIQKNKKQMMKSKRQVE